MKSNKVLKLLKITRPTLCKYVKNGTLKVKQLPSGFYDYDEESVYKFLNKDLERTNVIYCRVSTQKQKNDLENQKKVIESYCLKNGIKISDIYSDIGSGINFDRKEFQRLLNDVINHKISKIYITYKDRLSRISFDMFKNLFSEFNCEIVVLNDVEDSKTVEKEIFNEIISLIHCFAMKVYSSRRQKKLKCVEEDLKIEDEEL
jgi:putative resolvase